MVDEGGEFGGKAPVSPLLIPISILLSGPVPVSDVVPAAVPVAAGRTPAPGLARRADLPALPAAAVVAEEEVVAVVEEMQEGVPDQRAPSSDRGPSR